MTARREKLDSATETARVLRIFDLLVDELGAYGNANHPHLRRRPSGGHIIDRDAALRLLEVADRIAYRTEDPE